MNRWIIIVALISFWLLAQYLTIVILNDIWLALYIMLGGLIAVPVVMYLIQKKHSDH